MIPHAPDTIRLMPTISVILPAYQAAGHIAEAIAGLQAQTRPPDQIIVVDDGSTDATPAILAGLARRDPRLTVLRQDNQGASVARNRALAQATGTYLLLHDADDRLEDTALERLSAALARDSRAELVFAGCRHVDARGAPTGVVATPGRDGYTAAQFLVENPINTATGVLLRRSVLDRVPGFDTALRGYIDFDLYLAVARGGPGRVIALPDTLVRYRRHPGQITGNWRRMRENWHRIAAKHGDLIAGLGWRQRRTARARRMLFWAAVAYNAADFGAARRLVCAALRADPAVVLRSAEGRVRMLAAAASLLPDRAHDRLRARGTTPARSGPRP